MRIPTFRNRVSIILYQKAIDTDGGLITSPPTAFLVGERWANIRTVTGSERFRMQQLSAEAQHVVGLREYLESATEKMHVLFGTRQFEIESVQHDEMEHRWTTLFCREIKGATSPGALVPLSGQPDLTAGQLSDIPVSADEGDLYYAKDEDRLYVGTDPST